MNSKRIVIISVAVLLLACPMATYARFKGGGGRSGGGGASGKWVAAASLPATTGGATYSTAPSGGGGKLIIEPTGFKTLKEFANWITEKAIYIAIPIAILFVIWSGILFITSGGDPAKVKKAGQMLLWTAVGLAILFIGSGFVDLVMSIVSNAK